MVIHPVFKYEFNSMRILSKLIFVALLFLSAQRSSGQANRTLVVDKTEICRSNSKHSYQVFVPSVDPDFRQMPLLVLIDPHGDGKTAVAGFKEAAQKYQAVVVASDLIKNNDPNFIQEIEDLIADAKNRYPVGNVLFVGGFSGGARMALDYALSHPVAGVLACGALAKQEDVRAIQSKILCLMGVDDFNFIEAVPFILAPHEMPSNLAIEITNDSHRWPSMEYLGNATGYLLLSVAPPGTITEKRKYVRDFVAEQTKRIELLEKNQENLQSVLIARNLSICSVFERETTFLSVMDNKMNNPNYQEQVDKLKKIIEIEAKIRSSYFNALTKKDSTWWKPEIEALNSKIKSEKEPFALQSYQRIKGFLGIICYFMCGQFLQEKDIQNLEKVVWVYKMTEPRNSDMIEFSRKLAKLKTR